MEEKELIAIIILLEKLQIKRKYIIKNQNLKHKNHFIFFHILSHTKPTPTHCLILAWVRSDNKWTNNNTELYESVRQFHSFTRWDPLEGKSIASFSLQILSIFFQREFDISLVDSMFGDVGIKSNDSILTQINSTWLRLTQYNLF